MNRIKIILIFILLVNAKSLNGKSNLDFINGLDDVPLLTNMNIVKDSLVIFDTNEGKYITTEIEGAIKLKDAESYYKDILPNLGWKIIEKNKYFRGEETLSIQFVQKKDVVNIIFNLIAN